MFSKQQFKKLYLNRATLAKNSQDARIGKARSYPITNIIKSDKKVGKVFLVKCIFHDEKTSSLALYPETNTFHCFGCGVSGDSISLYKKVHSCSFNEAIEELTK